MRKKRIRKRLAKKLKYKTIVCKMNQFVATDTIIEILKERIENGDLKLIEPSR